MGYQNQSQPWPIPQPHTQSNGSIRPSTTLSIRSSTPSSIRKPIRTYTSTSSNLSSAYTPEDGYVVMGKKGQRPQPPARTNTINSRYVDMLLELDDIPKFHNILAAFSVWILLAGFIIFPTTLSNLSLEVGSSTNGTSTATAASNGTTFLSGTLINNATTHVITTTITSSLSHISLLITASICCGFGALLMLYLWFKHASNYVWITSRLFLPGCLNSLAGIVSTVAGVYGQNGGVWSTTARVTAAVAGGAMVITGGLYSWYLFYKLAGVRKGHNLIRTSEKV